MSALLSNEIVTNHNLGYKLIIVIAYYNLGCTSCAGGTQVLYLIAVILKRRLQGCHYTCIEAYKDKYKDCVGKALLPINKYKQCCCDITKREHEMLNTLVKQSHVWS